MTERLLARFPGWPAKVWVAALAEDMAAGLRARRSGRPGARLNSAGNCKMMALRPRQQWAMYVLIAMGLVMI